MSDTLARLQGKADHLLISDFENPRISLEHSLLIPAYTIRDWLLSASENSTPKAGYLVSNGLCITLDNDWIGGVAHR